MISKEFIDAINKFKIVATRISPDRYNIAFHNTFENEEEMVTRVVLDYEQIREFKNVITHILEKIPKPKELNLC